MECQALHIAFVGVDTYVLLLSAKRWGIWKKTEKNLLLCYNIQYKFQKMGLSNTEQIHNKIFKIYVKKKNGREVVNKG